MRVRGGSHFGVRVLYVSYRRSPGPAGRSSLARSWDAGHCCLEVLATDPDEPLSAPVGGDGTVADVAADGDAGHRQGVSETLCKWLGVTPRTWSVELGVSRHEQA